MRALLGLVPLLWLAACSEPPPSSGCTPAAPCGEEIVAGVSLTALFAPPTGGERAAVRERWAARAQAATGSEGPSIRSVTTGTDAGGATVRIVAGLDRVTGDTLFVAAIRRPDRPAGDARRRPVLLVLPETPGDVAADDLPAQTGLVASLRDEVVAVGVAARGAHVVLGARTFSSDAPATPYATDVDDAQAVLAAVPTLETSADAARLGASGLGRGGTAALLLRARAGLGGPVLGLALSYGAPTSWFTSSTRDAVRSFLAAGVAASLPDFARVMEATVRPLQRGEIDVAEARLRLLERSPAPFLVPRSTDPPVVSVVAVHGRIDPVVPSDHAGALLESLSTSGVVLQPEGLTHTTALTDEAVQLQVSQIVRDRFVIAP